MLSSSVHTLLTLFFVLSNPALKPARIPVKSWPLSTLIASLCRPEESFQDIRLYTFHPHSGRHEIGLFLAATCLTHDGTNFSREFLESCQASRLSLAGGTMDTFLLYFTLGRQARFWVSFSPRVSRLRFISYYGIKEYVRVNNHWAPRCVQTWGLVMLNVDRGTGITCPWNRMIFFGCENVALRHAHIAPHTRPAS